MPIFGPSRSTPSAINRLMLRCTFWPLHVQSGNLRLIRGNQVLVVELFQERHQHPEILQVLHLLQHCRCIVCHCKPPLAEPVLTSWRDVCDEPLFDQLARFRVHLTNRFCVIPCLRAM